MIARRLKNWSRRAIFSPGVVLSANCAGATDTRGHLHTLAQARQAEHRYGGYCCEHTFASTSRVIGMGQTKLLYLLPRR